MKLLELRKSNQKTQQDLANTLSIARTTYNSYELNNNKPDIETLCKIADYYGVSLDYLCEHKTNQIDISYYSPMAKEIVKKLPQLNAVNLSRLDSVCDGLILGQ